MRAVQGQLEEGLNDRGMRAQGQPEVRDCGDVWDFKRDTRLQAVPRDLLLLPRQLGRGLLELPGQSLVAHL